MNPANWPAWIPPILYAWRAGYGLTVTMTREEYDELVKRHLAEHEKLIDAMNVRVPL